MPTDPRIPATAKRRTRTGAGRVVDRAARRLAEQLRASSSVEDLLTSDALDELLTSVEGQLATVIRTERQDALNAATLDSIRSDSAGVRGWTLQSRPGACPTCAVMTGMVFALMDAPWQHPNCRCTVVPVYEGASVRGGYLVGSRVPRSVIAAALPASWGPLPRDLRQLLVVQPRPEWRPIRQMQNPTRRRQSGVA